jgi:hypothetical protein
VVRIGSFPLVVAFYIFGHFRLAGKMLQEKTNSGKRYVCGGNADTKHGVYRDWFLDPFLAIYTPFWP